MKTWMKSLTNIKKHEKIFSCLKTLYLFFFISGSQWSLSVITNCTISIQNVTPIVATPRLGAILGIAKIPQIITASGTSITKPLFKIEPCFIQINYQFNHFIFHDFNVFLKILVEEILRNESILWCNGFYFGEKRLTTCSILNYDCAHSFRVEIALVERPRCVLSALATAVIVINFFVLLCYEMWMQ